MYDYIVDSHCHLNLIEDKGVNFADIIANLKKYNVRILNNICTDIDKYEVISKYKDFSNIIIYSTIGDHPCTISNQRLPKSKNDILEYIEKYSNIIGIGETGLDYYHDKSFIDLQKISFLNHIQAAIESDLPVIIHNRNSDNDMIDILKSEFSRKSFSALLHCFSSSSNLAREAIRLGVYISISGIVTFKNAEQLKDIVKYIPLDLLLVETDSPFLAPTPYRGSINQPAYTSFVVDYIAGLKNVSRETIIDKTTSNFHKIFKRTKPL